MSRPPKLTSAAARRALVPIGVAALAASAAVIVATADAGAIGATARRALADPGGAAVVLAAYGSAFALRAALWRALVPALGFGHALAAVHVSLAGNHVLPARLGEALRVTSAVRRAGIPVAVATASTVALRAADVAAIAVLAGAFGPAAAGLGGALVWAAGTAAVLVWAGAAWWLRRSGVRARAVLVAAGALAAWVLESAVVWRAARWAGIEIGAADAIAVTAVTIAAQIVALAPGGLGTYEAAATASLVALGAGGGAALAAALAAHAFKTAYALAAGAVALFVPPPGELGRLRLSRAPDRVPRPPGPGPVVLVLPARDEQESVAAVVGRAPESAGGRPVRVVVVDDGSTDATAARAVHAGAEVVATPGLGLGGAVRTGLATALDRGAAAVAFCDADGEYAPEELDRLVAPILAGDADYVVGSRFDGDIRRMLPHRRAGNRLLTAALRLVARAPITDGQSGYRALSAEAAAAAEIIHDFNYAQVLTLDLLAKGFRYAEVPISYGFRTTGRSFVRPLRYLREVIPAVHRELNTGAGRSTDRPTDTRP